ncbi:DNA polymerase beta superfamily protein [Ferruginibacter sp. SUN106]|uniref:DNA polymerase beta superfamily protein n=1 Tax=Ferruginibacter sp. SUN106 TaxID=2978348 RepID=UPI003D35E0A2
MQKLTIDWIKDNGLLVFEVITGSRSYGLDTPSSDTDIKGVFVLPKNMFYGLEYTAQVNNDSNDIVYYELKRFMELLSKSNPNILEMLNVPDKCVLQKHPIMNMLQPEMFISKQCEQSFANYAFTQIKKAYGLEKKIVNPVEEERKSVLDFCFVYEDAAVPLKKYLEEKRLDPNKIGLAVIAHLRDCYNLYYSGELNYSGVVKKDNANDVSLSSIPKGEKPVAMLYFNKDAYSIYCKQYKEYWDWVAKRNEQRYDTTMLHGKKYDSKNMMHVFRLLLMAKEIAVEGKINVFRHDRDFLLAIKEGKFEYDELVQKAEALKNELPLLYQRSNLMNEPDVEAINELLVKMRAAYYLKF